MSDADLLREEITELEGQITRLKGSMGRADNGVKMNRLRIVTRLCARCRKALAVIEKREERE